MSERNGYRDLAAASELFERLIEEVTDRRLPRLQIDERLLQAVGEDGETTLSLAQIRASAARTIDLYAELFAEVFQLYADAVERVVSTRGRPVPPTAGGSPVTMTGTPGQATAAAVWLHNTTTSPLTDVSLRITGLTAHDGRRLNGLQDAFAPAALEVAAKSSTSATLSLHVPPDTVAGSYHGLVLASGLPGASVPVLLVVE